MHKLALLTFVVVAASAVGCGATSPSPTGPTRFSTAAGPLLSVRPSTLVAQPSAGFSCPAVPPFTVPFHLIVSTNDDALVVTNITMRFVDVAGAQMPQVTLPAPQVTLPAPVPTTQIGTALESARDLPLSLNVGCGTGHTGTLTLIIATLDGRGHQGSAQLAVDVR